MEQEIKDIIAKNLPAHVGDVLKQRLAEAEMDRKAVIKHEDTIYRMNQDITRLREQIQELENYKAANENLKLRLQVVESRENKLDVEKAQLIATEADKRANELYGLVQMVFRSPIYRKSVVNDLFSSYENGHHTITGGAPREVTEEVV